MLLYIDNMLIAAKSMDQIVTPKKQLSSEFEMKDLGAAKKILGMKIIKDRKYYFLVSTIIFRMFLSVLICKM